MPTRLRKMRSTPSGLVASTAATPDEDRQSTRARRSSSRSSKQLFRMSLAEEERQPALRSWTPTLWADVSTALHRHPAGTLTVIPVCACRPTALAEHALPSLLCQRPASVPPLAQWGRLELTEALAKGAFGRVSKGTYHFQEVAVKELLPGVGEAKDLLDEMTTMCQ